MASDPGLRHPCAKNAGKVGTDELFEICKLKSSIYNRNDFSANISTFQDQPPDRYRQFEASRTCAARIEVQHAVTRLLLRDMAVAKDDCVESGCLGLQVELPEIVQHVDGDA